MQGHHDWKRQAARATQNALREVLDGKTPTFDLIRPDEPGTPFVSFTLEAVITGPEVLLQITSSCPDKAYARHYQEYTNAVLLVEGMIGISQDDPWSGGPLKERGDQITRSCRLFDLDLDALNRALEELGDDTSRLGPPTPVSMAHRVKKDKLAEQLIEGKPARAVCGLWYVPTRDAASFASCNTCETILEAFATGSR